MFWGLGPLLSVLTSAAAMGTVSMHAEGYPTQVTAAVSSYDNTAKYQRRSTCVSSLPCLKCLPLWKLILKQNLSIEWKAALLENIRTVDFSLKGVKFLQTTWLVMNGAWECVLNFNEVHSHCKINRFIMRAAFTCRLNCVPVFLI